MKSFHDSEDCVKISIMMGNGVLHTFNVIPEKTNLHLFCSDFCKENNLDLDYEKLLQNEIKKYLVFHQKYINPESTKPLKKEETILELENFETNDKRFSFLPLIDKHSNAIINKKKTISEKDVYSRLYDKVLKK